MVAASFAGHRWGNDIVGDDAGSKDCGIQSKGFEESKGLPKDAQQEMEGSGHEWMVCKGGAGGS